MMEFLLGCPLVPIVVETGIGGGTVTCDLQPPAGEHWLIVEAYAFHNNDVAKSMFWTIHDGTDAIVHGATAALTAGGICALLKSDAGSATADGSFNLPLILNRLLHATASFNALTAGKKGTIHALVYKVRGDEYWA
jgi:hypothetical protein